MKTAWRSVLFVMSGIGRIVGASIAGACLCFVIGGLDGIVIGPFAYTLILIRAACSVNGSPPRVGGGAVIGVIIGAGVLGLPTGAITFALIEIFHLFSARRNALLRLDIISGIAARCGMICGFCGAFAGCMSPYSSLLSGFGMVVEGAIVGLSAGVGCGALWGSLARTPLVTHIPPFDAMLRWAWGENEVTS